jgi:secreted PhoX family phosphatase
MVAVVANQTETTTVSYSFLAGSGQLWVPGHTNGIASAYSPAQLLGGGAPDASVTLQIPTYPDGGQGPGPETVAFDSSGNLWIASSQQNASIEPTVVKYAAGQLGSSGTLAPSVTLTPVDAGVYTDGGFTRSIDFPEALAFDVHGNLWVANCGDPTSSVVMFAAAALVTGGAVSPSVVWASSALDCPNGLAFDTAGNLWVSNCGNTGTLLKFSESQLNSPTAPTPEVAPVGWTTFRPC